MKNNAKNVLFIICDSMRADALPMNGNEICRMPNLQTLAQDGANFSNCFSQNPVCAPSRAAILTGWYPHVRGHRTFTYHIQPDEENLLKYFKRENYLVKAVGTNDCLHEDCFPDSMDEWLESHGGACDSMKGSLSDDPVKRSAFMAGLLSEEQAKDRNWSIKENALNFIRETTDQPFFLYCAFHIPHPKYGAPEPWFSMYDPADMPEPVHCEYADKHPYMRDWHELCQVDKLAPETIRQIRSIYYGMCSLTDHYVGEIVNTLKAAGKYEDTTVVFLSDHGDFTGDYGLVEKGEMMVQDCIVNVPLIIKPASGLDITSNRQVDNLVETIDILPSLLEMHNIELRHNQFGESLVTLMRNQTDRKKQTVIIEGGYGANDHFALNGIIMKDSAYVNDPEAVYGPRLKWEAQHPEYMDRFICLRTDKWKYVRRENTPDELYDLVNDPAETVNCHAAMEHSPELAGLKEMLLGHYLTTSDAVSRQIDARLCNAAWSPEKGLR